MAERYSRLFSLEPNLYEDGAPVLIEAGALLKDTLNGRILSQLKLKNISQKPIKAVKVRIYPLDTVNNPLGEPFEFDYLDLNSGRGSEFGQKVPIVIPNTSTRAFKVSVTEAAFTDNSVWKGSGEEWTPFPAPQKIHDYELLRQYKMHFGDFAVFLPVFLNGAWRCACGSINNDLDNSCRDCGCKIDKLKACDIEKIKAEKDKRLADEKAAEEKRLAEQKAAEERRIKEEQEARVAKAKKTKKALAIALPSIAVIAAALVLTFLVIIPGSKYQRAKALFEEGKYNDAIAAFDALNGYKDSAAQIENCKSAIKDKQYDSAVKLYNDGKYDEAIAAFNDLNGYKDSIERITACEAARLDQQYNSAMDLYNAGQFEEAIVAFQTWMGIKTALI